MSGNPFGIELCFAISEKESGFEVQPHFHPKSTEHFKILEGKVHFELDGKEFVANEGEDFFIPRGVVHRVWSPEEEKARFKLKGDHEPYEERDCLIDMFTLMETNQFGLLQKYACWYRWGNFVPPVGWIFPKTVGRILVWFIGGILGTFLGLAKARLKKD